MTYHQFNPSTDTLEVGTKIRLAGREGEIKEHWLANHGFKSGVEWNANESNNLYLENFTFEIAGKPAKPLTIDKRVKGEILCMMSDQGTALDKFITIEDYLNSLEET